MAVITIPDSSEIVNSGQTNSAQKIDFAATWDFLVAQLGKVSGQGPQTVASASTVNLDAVTDTRDILISGTTAITAFTVEAGKVFRCRASGAFTLTNNSGIVTQRGANIVCASGDSFILRATAADTVEVLCFTRAVAPPFSASYTSPQQTITLAGALSLTHSLGGMPSLVQARLKCVTAEGGYSIGDEVIFNPQGDYDGSASRGLSIVPTSTTLEIRYSSNGFQMVRKDNGSLLSVTAANWNLIVRAWA